MENKTYYLCGPDGSGKTSYIENIEKTLKVRKNSNALCFCGS